jgi:hypothetical protein
MKYFKLGFWITILLVFAGWLYLMYRMENKRISNNIKCGKFWHSSEAHCEKLYDGIYESRNTFSLYSDVDKVSEEQDLDDTQRCK